MAVRRETKPETAITQLDKHRVGNDTNPPLHLHHTKAKKLAAEEVLAPYTVVTASHLVQALEAKPV